MYSNIPEEQLVILEGILHGVIVTDMDGHIIYFNKAYKNLFNYSKTEVMGKSVVSLYSDTDIPFSNLLDQISKNERAHVRWSGVRKDKTNLWLEIRASRLDVKEGKPALCIITLQKIDDIVEIENQLENTRKLAKAIIDTSMDAIISVDEEGLIHCFNRAAVNMFRYSEKEATGKSANLLLPYSNEALGRFLKRLQSEPGNFVERGKEFEAMRKDGTLFPAEVSVTEIHWKERLIFIVTIKDLTRERELEERIEKIQQEERNKIGSELHDNLGQVLTAVSLLSQNLSKKLRKKDSPGVDEIDEISRMVKKADEDARGLAHGLVPDLGKTGLPEALEDLCEKTRNCTDIYCTFSGDRDIEFDDPNIPANLFRIAQEAVNNAVKHSGASHIHIRLLSQPFISLQIEDDGIGFSPKEKGEKGSGIKIMKHRAKKINGQFRISRSQENYTQIRCDLHYTSAYQ